VDTITNCTAGNLTPNNATDGCTKECRFPPASAGCVCWHGTNNQNPEQPDEVEVFKNVCVNALSNDLQTCLESLVTQIHTTFLPRSQSQGLKSQQDDGSVSRMTPGARSPLLGSNTASIRSPHNGPPVVGSHGSVLGTPSVPRRNSSMSNPPVSVNPLTVRSGARSAVGGLTPHRQDMPRQSLSTQSYSFPAAALGSGLRSGVPRGQNFTPVTISDCPSPLLTHIRPLGEEI